MPSNQEILSQIKIDGALGAMIIEDQPTHSIYPVILTKHNPEVNKVKVKT